MADVNDHGHIRISTVDLIADQSGGFPIAACGAIVEWTPAATTDTAELSRVTCPRCLGFLLARRCTPATDCRTFDPKDGPVVVSIVYFKPRGKWYCEDESVLWHPDPSHYTKWQPFEALHRIRAMFAVCMATPLGFPVSNPPSQEAWREAYS